MKTNLSLYLLLAAATSGIALGAETAYTNPVGYVSIGDTTPGQPAIKANTDVAVSIPLRQVDEYAGAVLSTTATTITVAGSPAWANNVWATSTNIPYLVSVNSGTNNGFLGLITSNTANTLTVTPVTSGNIVSLVASDKISIYKSWTLISLFPSGTFSPGTRILAYSGNVAGENLASNLQYVWTGTQWTQLVGGSGIANSTILYSGESFVIRSTATPVNSLVISGAVPTSNSRTDIVKLGTTNQDNRISYFAPVDELIGNSGLGFTPGDRLLAFNNAASGVNKAPSEILVYTGSGWTGLVGVSGNQTNIYTLKGGRGYVYRRASTAAVGVRDWSDQQTYIPNL